MTDIESNFLYLTLLRKFRQQFDVACRRSYVIALPVNEALQNISIDQAFVNSHILMPSKLLKMHYTPLQVGYAADDIEIDGKRLILHQSVSSTTTTTTTERNRQQSNSSKVVIKILAEEISYNSENKPFKLLIIDKPLISYATNDSDHHSSSSTSSSASSSPSSSSSGLIRQKNLLLKSLSLFGARSARVSSYMEPPELLLDHSDCSRYLESISQQITVELEREVQRIQSKYIILSHYLLDASDRIARLTETFIPRYIDQCRAFEHCRSNKVIECIRTSVENYVIHLLHGKLIASIYHRYEREDLVFEQKLELIKRSHLSVCQLGAQAPFRDLEIDDKIKDRLRSMVSLQSPLAMVNAIVSIIDGISSGLDNCVRISQMMKEFEPAAEQKVLGSVSICSDDLIASLIFALVQARPSRVYSMSKYLELLNWSARDRAAYYTATFHVVVQYIYNYCSELG